MIKKKFFVDILLNIIASVVPIIILQFFALPLVNKGINNPEEYGLIITIISLLMMTSRTYGNTLNNVRLIMNNKYLEDKDEGDFNVLLMYGSIIITIILAIIIVNYYNITDMMSVFLIGLISLTMVFKEYLIVSFRLELSYKRILVNNFILVLGYFIGCFLFILTGYWQSIYIVGQVFSLIYIIRNSKLLKEKLEITTKFKETTYKTVLLSVTSLLSTTTSYADKILLYPLLGGTVVAIYYASTLLGKIVGLMISPTSNVLLSYLSRKTKISLNTFYTILIISIFLSIPGYFIAIFISKPILSFIYPEYAADAVILIPITSASAMISLIIAMIDPIVMKFKNINWQIYVNTQHVIIYVALSIFLTHKYGVIGFAISISIALMIKLLSLIIIYVFTKTKKQEVFYEEY